MLSHDAEIYIFPQYPELPTQHDTIKSVFTGMTYGIYSLHSGAQYAIHIYDAIFDQNQKGAYLSGFNGSSYVEAYRNRFRVLDPGLPDGELQTYGMYLNNCTGYTIEENKFYCGAQDKNGYGLIINESGPYDNEVYNNAFYNLQTGSQAQGCNRYSDHGEGGLCYKCNDFFLNFNDILIISEAEPGTPNQGISIYQGTKSFTAKNTFTEGNNNSYDIHNPFDQIIYCSDGIPPGQMNFHPIPIIGVEEEIILNSTYNKIADCPSSTGGLPDLYELLGDYNQAQIESDSIYDDLNSLVDGGSTQELVATVETSIPPEAVEITNELLSQSPYLSDSVMKSAIEKEAVLPNAMIRDILVENPQSAKSDALMEALEQRFVPMPDSMMAQIVEGQNMLGAKENTELELAYRQQKASIAAKKLKRIYDTDTTGTFGIDSLISMASEENTLMSRYDLVSLYYRKGMFETGNALLNNIPTIFQLTGDQQTVYDMYIALYPIIQQIVTNPNGLDSVDSMQVATLSSLAQDDQFAPGAYARNILIKKGVLQYQEPILIASNLKETRRWKLNDPSHGRYDEFMLKIYPNPAKGYFVVEYRAAKEANKNGSLSVTLTTIAGKEVMNFSAGRNYDQIAVPTNNLPSGSYIVSLKWNGSTKDHVKLIISK
ncbi:MAG TPA: T9SS type A sorting domain-containing protein [Bacteroidales bacterium]|nr:T9SS type A sorting domain-containing protein [Bacteroidales bacterium]